MTTQRAATYGGKGTICETEFELGHTDQATSARAYLPVFRNCQALKVKPIDDRWPDGDLLVWQSDFVAMVLGDISLCSIARTLNDEQYRRHAFAFCAYENCTSGAKVRTRACVGMRPTAHD